MAPLAFWVAAASCAFAALLLGLLVSRPIPPAIDRAAFALRGRGIAAALFFTLLGRWRIVIPVGLIALGVAAALHDAVTPVLTLLVAHVISQGCNSMLKRLYGRRRPDDFIGPSEPEKSYPSGHAVTAIVFYGGFTLVATRAPFSAPLEILVLAGLMTCTLAIPWSRVALGAHYLTDVLGGTLFGLSWLCAALALYRW